jgi:hypothetical protein
MRSVHSIHVRVFSICITLREQVPLSTFPCTVDDGTSVIDCSDRHPPPSPKRVRITTMDMELPEPKVPFGTTVVVTGKITKWFETRQIVIDDIREWPFWFVCGRYYDVNLTEGTYDRNM